MSQGRGSAVVAAAAVLCLLMVLNSEVVQAATYKVGGARGWTFIVVGWPKGKNFKAGDVLLFSYRTGAHDVAVVNKAGYDSCKVPSNAKVYSSGKDQIKLVKGKNFFICTFPFHCAFAMKIAVTAT
ncbi:Basic blue protein [Actinidia chinensis var. chinensis]|uniref:Basic blue protein n=1 Tax=Actinidia chinensis var. chinensis TaxID=1590841 RepID=A0A2R6Q6F7_ACTCC|nr:Basic blue protein [Actinidia chinensis var. chinensis]